MENLYREAIRLMQLDVISNPKNKGYVVYKVVCNPSILPIMQDDCSAYYEGNCNINVPVGGEIVNIDDKRINLKITIVENPSVIGFVLERQHDA